MRRGLKQGLAGLGVVLALGGGFAAWRIRASFKGPPLPICHAPMPRRGRFEAPRQLSGPKTPGARTYDIEPSAAVLPDGTLAIVYNPRDPIWKATSGLATAAVSPDGSVDVRAYPNDRDEAFDAWMTAGPDGKARMVWLAHNGGRPEKDMRIAFAESADGHVWSSPPTTAHAPADCPDNTRGCLDKPMIAASNDALFVAYSSTVGEGLRLTRGALNAPRFESSVLAGDGAYADMDVTPAGVVHLVYGSGGPNASSAFGDPDMWVEYVRSEDGGKTFSKPVRVSAATESFPFFFSNPQVEVDEARGLLYVAYPAGGPDGKWEIMLATSKDAGKSWSRVKVNDDAPCATHMTPHAALDALTGTLYLSWLDNRDGQGALVAAACAPGGASCGANEKVSDAPFRSFTFERHLPAWLSEYGALVVDAKHRWLHAVWTQPVDEDGASVSRIFHARAPLPAAPPQ